MGRGVLRLSSSGRLVSPEVGVAILPPAGSKSLLTALCLNDSFAASLLLLSARGAHDCFQGKPALVN
jgi:hypothetical protein